MIRISLRREYLTRDGYVRSGYFRGRYFGVAEPLYRWDVDVDALDTDSPAEAPVLDYSHRQYGWVRGETRDAAKAAVRAVYAKAVIR